VSPVVVPSLAASEEVEAALVWDRVMQPLTSCLPPWSDSVSPYGPSGQLWPALSMACSWRETWPTGEYPTWVLAISTHVEITHDASVHGRGAVLHTSRAGNRRRRYRLAPDLLGTAYLDQAGLPSLSGQLPMGWPVT
jgi:hypothetical protein